MEASSKIFSLFAFLLAWHLTGASQTIPQIGSIAPADKVAISATVLNKEGNPVTGLQRNNFQISVDKKPANILDFREEDLPLSVGIVFDASASIVDGGRSAKGAHEVINSVQQAMRAFLETSNPSNEYFLIAFNNKPQLLLDWTSDSKAIIDALDVVRPTGNTALFDACYLGINKVQHGRYSKPVLVLITDGQDNSSTYSFSQVREALRASDVLVYSVFSSRERSPVSAPALEGQEILNQFSLISGGLFFYKWNPKVSDTVSVFENIATELRHQYTIVLTPDMTWNDRKWHAIKMKVEAASDASNKMKQLSVRSREGFYLNRR
jgi:Ca-activated chloride channel family protein